MTVAALQYSATIHQRQTLLVKARLLSDSGLPLSNDGGGSSVKALVIGATLYDLTDPDEPPLNVLGGTTALPATGTITFNGAPAVNDTITISDGTTPLIFTFTNNASSVGWASANNYNSLIGAAAGNLSDAERTAINMLTLFGSNGIGAPFTGGYILDRNPTWTVKAAIDPAAKNVLKLTNVAGGTAGNVAITQAALADPPPDLFGMQGGTDGDGLTQVSSCFTASGAYRTDGWSLGGPGYNFGFAVPNTSVFWSGGHRYRLELQITYDETVPLGHQFTSTGPIVLHCYVDVLPAYGAAG